MDTDSALVNAVDAEGTPIGSVNQRNALSCNDSEAPRADFEIVGF
jgi:hypothetical protein